MAQERRARGRRARQPSDIPMAGWGDIGIRVKNEVADDKITVLAASLAYYALLAIFPALIAAISIYGLLFDPQQVENQIQNLVANLPPDTAGLITRQLQNIAQTSTTGLGWAAAASIAGALWATSSGVQSLIVTLNIAYDEEEDRGFIKLRLVALALSIGVILLGLIAVALIAAAPNVLTGLGLGTTLTNVITWGRWVILALLAMAALAVLYRYGPNRHQPRWRWVSWGAVIATLLWLVGSALFSWYVASFGNFNETYGSRAGVIVLMLWFYLTGFAVLLGAELNAEVEHQTMTDTTVDEERPMGARGAHVADTLGEQRRD